MITLVVIDGQMNNPAQQSVQLACMAAGGQRGHTLTTVIGDLRQDEREDEGRERVERPASRHRDLNAIGGKEVLLFLGCLTSQQLASVSQGRI